MKKQKQQNVIVLCNKCNTPHFKVSNSYIITWQENMNFQLKTRTTEELAQFGIDKLNPPKAETFLTCSTCNNSYIDFRLASNKECKNGTQVAPIFYSGALC